MNRKVEVLDKISLSRIRKISPNILEHVNLSEFSRWKTGGTARCVAIPKTSSELASLIAYCSEKNIPHLIVGSTSNLLFSDNNLDFLLINIGSNLNKIEINENTVVAEAGIWVPYYVQKVARASLAGAQHMAGIPGTLGGLIYMNGGSQRKGVGDALVSVESINCQGERIERSAKECNFAYRHSSFQENGEIIAKATFLYDFTQDKRKLLAEIRSILRSRRLKFPLKLPNCGSVFVSDPALYDQHGPPGQIFEELNLKGLQYGQAMISLVHANFVVNLGGASSSDILFLIYVMQKSAEEKTGVRLNSEVRYVSDDGTTSPADVEARRRYSEAN